MTQKQTIGRFSDQYAARIVSINTLPRRKNEPETCRRNDSSGNICGSGRVCLKACVYCAGKRPGETGRAISTAKGTADAIALQYEGVCSRALPVEAVSRCALSVPVHALFTVVPALLTFRVACLLEFRPVHPHSRCCSRHCNGFSQCAIS